MRDRARSLLYAVHSRGIVCRIPKIAVPSGIYWHLGALDNPGATNPCLLEILPSPPGHTRQYVLSSSDGADERDVLRWAASYNTPTTKERTRARLLYSVGKLLRRNYYFALLPRASLRCRVRGFTVSSVVVPILKLSNANPHWGYERELKREGAREWGGREREN